jgi:hypothetical protein
VLLLLGNLAFIGAWGVTLWRPAGWKVLGLVLIVLFLLLRVGGIWWNVMRYPDDTGRTRRSAVITTVVALLGVALWGFTVVRGTREAPRVEHRVVHDDASSPTPAGASTGQEPH